MAAYLYNVDKDNTTDDGYSTSYYAKYMIYENKARTGGFAVKAGTGTFPGTINSEVREKMPLRRIDEYAGHDSIP